jgi:hypothetical protein
MLSSRFSATGVFVGGRELVGARQAMARRAGADLARQGDPVADDGAPCASTVWLSARARHERRIDPSGPI